MSRIVTAGAESLVAPTATANPIEGPGYSGNDTNKPTIDTAGPLHSRSTAAWKANLTLQRARWTLTGALATDYYTRVYLYIDAAALSGILTILEVQTNAAATLCRVRLDTNLTLVATDSANTVLGTSAALSTGQWYIVEQHFKIGSGTTDDTYEVRVYQDGQSVPSPFYSSTTVSIGTVAPNFLLVGPATLSGTITMHWDDVAINDSAAGSGQTSWCGTGVVQHSYPTGDGTRVGWTAGAGGTTSLFDAVDNKPPVGVVTASATNTSQIKDGTSNTTDTMSFNMVDYTTLGIASQPVFVEARAVVGNSTTTSTSVAVQSTSNPAITEATQSTGTTAAGTYPTGWTAFSIGKAYAPSVTLGTQPVTRVRKNTASTDVAGCCSVFLVIETGVGATLTQSLSDTPGLADALTPEHGFTVSPADTPTLADGIASFDYGKGLADTAALADAASPATGFARTLADTPALADAQTLSQGWDRTIADTPGLADAQSVSHGWGLLLADTPALADAIFPGAWWAAVQALSVSPLAWVRLDALSGTAESDVSGNGHNGTYVNAPTLGVQGASAGEPDPGVTFNGVDEYLALDSLGSLGSSTGSISLVTILAMTDKSFRYFPFGCLNSGSPATGGIEMYCNREGFGGTLAPGRIEFQFCSVAGNLRADVVATSMTIDLFDGNPHLVVCRVTSGSTMEVRIDNQVQPLAYYATGLSSPANLTQAMYLAAHRWAGFAVDGFGPVTMWEWLAFATNLTNTDCDNLWAAAQLLIHRALLIADTPALADAVTANRGIAQAVDDTASLADAFTFGYGPGLADTVALADAQAFAKGYALALADTPGLADALSTLAAFALTVADNPALVDSVAFEVGKGLADTAALADLLTPSQGFVRTLADNPTLADALSSLTAFALSLADTPALADARAFGYGPTLSDNPTLVDALSTVQAFGVLLADNPGLADSVVAAAGFARSIADNPGLADALALGFGPLIADNPGLADALAFAADWSRLIADAVLLGDNAITNLLGAGSLALNDTVPLSDTATTAADYVRALSDALGLADQATPALAFSVAVTDTTTLVDALSLSAGYARTIADLLALADQLDTLSPQTLALVDSVPVTDQLAMQAAYQRALADTAAVLDAVATKAAFDRTLVDVVPLSDLVVTAADYFRTLTDTVAVVDLVAPGFGFDRRLADTLALLDALDFQVVEVALRPLTMELADRQLLGLTLRDEDTGQVTVAVREAGLVGHDSAVLELEATTRPLLVLTVRATRRR